MPPRAAAFSGAPLSPDACYAASPPQAKECSRLKRTRAHPATIFSSGAGGSSNPSQNLFDDRDVAITGGRVTHVGAGIPETEARQVLNAKGKIVTPGLIDVHVHVYDGVAPLGIPADPNCVAKGATTVWDAGSAGAHTFSGAAEICNPSRRYTGVCLAEHFSGGSCPSQFSCS
jgi:cytosine/adenosine deaminase-related metal-dependent hydrolase